MKTLKLVAFLSILWFLAACGSSNDLPLEAQAPGGCIPSPTPCPTASSWVSLGNPVYAGSNPNNYSVRGHRDVEVVVSNNVPTLAYLEWHPVAPGTETYMRSDLVVSQWNNTSKTWNKLGSAVDATDSDVKNFSLAAKGSKIVVAYDLCNNLPADNVCDGGGYTTYVKQWIGTTWQQLGGSFCSMSMLSCSSKQPQVALDSGGNPFLLLHDPTSGVSVHRWNAVTSSWQQLGGKLDSYTYSYIPQGNGQDLQIVVDNQSNPVVAFVEGEDYDETGYLRVKGWNGSSWQTFGLSGAAVTTPKTDNFKGYSLTLSAGVTPVVAYSLNENGTAQMSARYFAICSSPLLRSYPCWKDLGDQASLGVGKYPVLVSYNTSSYSVYPQTSYMLAYQNNDNLYVKSSRGSGGWSLVGTNPLDVTPNYTVEVHAVTVYSVVTATTGTTATYSTRPLVVWLEPNDPMNYKKFSTVYAKGYQ